MDMGKWVYAYSVGPNSNTIFLEIILIYIFNFYFGKFQTHAKVERIS